MGEELKESKLYFKTSEDDEYKELESVGIQELQVNNIKFEETAYKEYQEEMMKLYDAFQKIMPDVKRIAENITLLCKCVFDKEASKQLKKLAGLSPLSKKRTRKLLMAHGFDRNTAQMYADTMYPRNITEIEKITLIVEKEGK